MGSEEKGEAQKKLDIYDRQPYPPEVRYEVVQLPLQGYVSLARQEVQAGWWAVQTRWQRLQCSLKELVTKARTQTQDQLKSVGVSNPAAVAKVTGIGGGALVGYLLARKRSVLLRVLYPTLGASIVAGSLFFSSAQNRSQFWEKAGRIQHGYRESLSQWTDRKGGRGGGGGGGGGGSGSPASQPANTSDTNPNNR